MQASHHTHHTSWIRLLGQEVLRSWWVILFALICGIVYEQAVNRQIVVYMSLQEKLSELEKEKNQALAIRENLQHQINSQSDQEWIEMTLMKGLGLVPEGQTKVYFSQHR